MWTSVSSKTWSARFALAAVTTIANTSFDVRVRAEAQPVPVKVCDPANRVTVYVWPRGPGDIVRGNPGHAVIRTYRGGEDGKGIYASFWPKDKKRILAKGVHHSVSLEDDIKAEDGENPLAITLYSLNVDRINAEYLKFKKSGENWSLLGSALFFKDEKTRNCCGLSHDLLLQGGLKNLLSTGNSAVYNMMTDPVFIGTVVIATALVAGSYFFPDQTEKVRQEAVKAVKDVIDRGAKNLKEVRDAGNRLRDYTTGKLPDISSLPIEDFTGKFWKAAKTQDKGIDKDFKTVYQFIVYPMSALIKVPGKSLTYAQIGFGNPNGSWLLDPKESAIAAVHAAEGVVGFVVVSGATAYRVATLPVAAALHGLLTMPYEILSLAAMAKDAEVAKGYVDQVESVKSVTPVLDSLTVKSGKVVDEPRPS